ncbi:hypothetical protein [Curtobacterium sp. MCBA15_004]|uniref:hypothetical protein n=1 Tax=Curtobacterium sp. MCBA15_004 TaxID=1898733 RepID=UPI0008DD410E|nr:hypothetical protein [Curtobacterium sp. MCBA15_004]WIA96267.1 hypothetical protein QOL16_14325 [Curtobacterium sp. MCBA15_004]
MRLLAYLLTVVVLTARSLGAGLLVALQLDGAPQGLRVATSITTPFLVLGPMLIGAFAGYWDHRSSPEGRRYLRWWFVGVVGADVVAAVVAAVVLVLASVAAGAPSWVPVVLIAGAAVLLAVARPLGDRFRRTEPVVDRPGDDVVPAPTIVRRKVRTIAVTFAIAAAVASMMHTLLATLLRERGPDLAQEAFLAGQLTFTATAIAAVLVSLPFSRALRATGGRDIGRLRRFAQVVLRGKALLLDAEDQRGALRYARLLPLVLRFQLAFTGLLYGGITCQFVSYAVRGELGLLPVVFLLLMAAVLLWAAPPTLRRIRRARAYADLHGDGARSAVDGGAPAPVP